MDSKSKIVKLIEHWSKSFGAPVLKKPEVPSRERIYLAEGLIHEEHQEFVDATAHDEIDLIEVCDSLGDTLWVVIRAFQEFGIDPDKVIEEIYKSNMSKLCETEEEAKESVELYSKGEHPNKKEVVECYYEKSGLNWVVKRRADDKIMKSHKFREPDFLSIVNQK